MITFGQYHLFKWPQGHTEKFNQYKPDYTVSYWTLPDPTSPGDMNQKTLYEPYWVGDVHDDDLKKVLAEAGAESLASITEKELYGRQVKTPRHLLNFMDYCWWKKFIPEGVWENRTEPAAAVPRTDADLIMNRK